jgi:cytochrome c oxidase cbb3-type subunit 3
LRRISLHYMQDRARSSWSRPIAGLATLALVALIGRTQTAARHSAEDGRKLFAISCAPCHGRSGEGAQSQSHGMNPPDLTRGVFKHGNSDSDLFVVISKGVPEGGMPSFEPMGTEPIWSLVAFVRTLSRSQSPLVGNAAAGAALFWGKGACGRCHSVGSKGTSFGPDLTQGSRRSTAQRIRKSIVSPDDEITPGYEVVTILTRDHKTVSGLSRFYDDFSARVIDSSGGERTYLREDVVSMRREMRSLMPSDFGTVFTGAELDDLVAYIMTLRSEGAIQ